MNFRALSSLGLLFSAALTGVLWSIPARADDQTLDLKKINEKTDDLLLMDEKCGIRLYFIGENNKEHAGINHVFFSLITQSLNLMENVPDYFCKLNVMRIIFSDHEGRTANISQGVMRIGAHNYSSRHRDAYYWAGTIVHEIIHEEQRLRVTDVSIIPRDLLEYHATLYELDFLEQSGASQERLQRQSNHLTMLKSYRKFFDDKKDFGRLIDDIEEYLSQEFGFSM